MVKTLLVVFLLVATAVVLVGRVGMATPSASVKSRVAARGWVTRAAGKLEKILELKVAEVNLAVLSDAIDEFDKRITTLDSVQIECEMELDVDDLDDDIEKADLFRDKARVPRVKAGKLLVDISPSRPPSPTGSVPSTVRSMDKLAKLPKLELPHFSGVVIEWPCFWDKFKAIVDSSDLPVVSKFTYLQSLLDGEAKAAIAGLSLTGEHYRIACDILEQRYGRREKIIFAHIQELMNMSVPSTKQTRTDVNVLWKLQDDLQAHVRSLETLGVKGTEYGVILTPLILARLPQDIRMEWAREGEGKESDLKFLMDFMHKEIQRRERSQTFRDSGGSSSTGATAGGPSSHVAATEARHKPANRPATAAALQTSSDNGCGFCGGRHASEKCYGVLGVPVADRKQKIIECRLCFRCLSKSHQARRCSAKCAQCKGRHSVIICTSGQKTASDINTASQPGAGSNTQSSDTKIKTSVSCVAAADSNHGNSRRVILQCARVRVRGNSGTANANVLFDTGSDRTYISSSLVQKVNPMWIESQSVAYASFGNSGPSKSEMRQVYKVKIGEADELVATEVPVICAPVYRPEIPESVLKYFGELNFADCYDEGKSVTVDILIGLDNYWRFIKPSVVCGPEGLVAQQSVFGWIISGSYVGPQSSPSGALVSPSAHSPSGGELSLSDCSPGGELSSSDCSSSVVSHQLLCLNDIPEARLRSFWELEAIGVSDKQNVGSHPVLSEFQRNVNFSEGRYEVGLPWKRNLSGKVLLNNESLARKRLVSLSHKLSRDDNLRSRYDQALDEMEVTGVTEEVPAHELSGPYPIFYMPHRPVIRESSVSTKVRPVFDASARGFNGVSLNDCLETGPSMIPNLVAILIRFRRWLVALTADVTKAFLQIRIQRSDRDVHRFLWENKGTVRVMRFTRVPFGNKSSPFLLNATIQHHLSKFPPTRVIEELQQNLYVDDWISGGDDDEEGCSMMVEAEDVMAQAGMPLAKWGSNSDTVSHMVYSEYEGKHLESDSLKVLGMRWLPSADRFSFDGVEVIGQVVVTKRVVLSYIARLFDPLGFLTPFTMLAKIVFQDIWRLGLDWDAEVPGEVQSQFHKWLDGLPLLRQWQIHRSYTGRPWRENVEVEIHGFGDASERGYGSCVYLVVKSSDGSCTSSLVTSRARVAPLKKITLPRLELLGALLCSRLVQFVREALLLPAEVKCTYWTDSMVVLSWVQGEPSRWKAFIANRVTEIQNLSSPSQWRHCPGIQNPSDLVTRGLHAQELISSELWLSGPTFLSSMSETSTSDEVESVKADVQVELSEPSLELTLVTVDTVSTCSRKLVEVERWSTLEKGIRIVAWLLRFIHNLKVQRCDRKTGELSLEELTRSKVQLLLSTQQHAYAEELDALRQGKDIPRSSSLVKLSPFVGEDGLLRVQGRLQFSNLDYFEKHPAILPKGHLSLLLVRFHHVLMKHAGVGAMMAGLRNYYWIVGLRCLAKRVRRECVVCKRLDAKPCVRPVAPLPELRTKQAPPFAVVGMDYAGPLYCCDFPSKKHYVLLFTCAVVRAVHLELVDSLSLDDHMLALRRFAARRGMPSTIYTDNAQTFKAAQTKLVRSLGSHSPEWRFIAPRSPWWGGWWERLVGSIKSALKRSIGSRSLTRVELSTNLAEVESCVNSRPLTFVGDEPETGRPLTPSHFLIGRGSGFHPVVSLVGPPVLTAEDLVAREQVRNHMLDRFWSLWTKDYIRNLPPWRGPKARGVLGVGSVVLIREDNTPRLLWPMGVVQHLYPGKDGVSRAVQIKTKSGLYVRPVQRLHSLEVGPECLSECLSESLGSATNHDTNATQRHSINEDALHPLTEHDVFSDTPRSAVPEHDSANDTPCSAVHKVVKPNKVTRVGRVSKPPVKLDM